jgi:hypothetical protein
LPATAWPIFCPASPDPNFEGEGHERPESRFCHPCRRNHGRHLPDQHARPGERNPGRLYLQSELDSRCRAACIPHRSAHAVRSGARGHRARHPGGDAPLHLVFARRGGRVRIAQSVSRRGGAGCASLRPDRGNGVDRGSGRPPALEPAISTTSPNHCSATRWRDRLPRRVRHFKG